MPTLTTLGLLAMMGSNTASAAESDLDHVFSDDATEQAAIEVVAGKSSAANGGRVTVNAGSGYPPSNVPSTGGPVTLVGGDTTGTVHAAAREVGGAPRASERERVIAVTV